MRLLVSLQTLQLLVVVHVLPVLHPLQEAPLSLIASLVEQESIPLQAMLHAPSAQLKSTVLQQEHLLLPALPLRTVQLVSMLSRAPR